MSPMKNISELRPFKSLKVEYLSELNTAVVTAVKLPLLRQLGTQL